MLNADLLHEYEPVQGPSAPPSPDDPVAQRIFAESQGDPAVYQTRMQINRLNEDFLHDKLRSAEYIVRKAQLEAELNTEIPPADSTDIAVRARGLEHIDTIRATHRAMRPYVDRSR